MLTGAQCADGKCSCVSGYTYLRGRCRKLVALGEPCDEVHDCQFNGQRDSVQCLNNICDCAEGFYKRTENVCRRISLSMIFVVFFCNGHAHILYIPILYFRRG